MLKYDNKRTTAPEKDSRPFAKKYSINTMIQQNINVLDLEQRHEADYVKSLAIPVIIHSLIEIDSETEFDTELFRVWYGEANLGTFRIDNEGWLAEPFYDNPGRKKTVCVSADEARHVIVAAYSTGRGI